ncbi:response regulator [Morganella morganii]|uniref:response regulator n=1 Tax=Morganella morganii TaxID=582 RepID=UPI00339C7715
MQESYKVLVVDDDMRLRALLERYLSEQGFQVRTAANAEQMDRLLTRESIHLIVLDLMLPGEDGLSICRRLRSQNNPIPIIMVTAKGEEVDRIVGLEIGADDYIPKPFNPREPLSRDKLMSLARGREYSAMERSIDVQISRLRRMIEEDPTHPRYIQTVWGLGYVFVPDGNKA